jgi:hypothetical protein
MCLTRFLRCLALVAGLALLVHRPVGAQIRYDIQPIVKRGDAVGDLRIKTDGDFFIGTLNDRDQLVLVAESAAGGKLLIRYADGKLTPIAAPGRTAPGGTWSRALGIASPVSMNQLGSIVFAAEVEVANRTEVGTFLWDDTAQQVTSLARKGMLAGDHGTLEVGGGRTPVINNQNEVALVAALKNAAGQTRDGVFLLGRDGRLQPIALPGDPLPDGRPTDSARLPSLNDAGRIALLARPRGGLLDCLCAWEQSRLTPMLTLREPILGDRLLLAFTGIWINSRNQNILLGAHVHDLSGASTSLYLLANGALIPVAVPGQQMPGGGRFQTIQPQDPNSDEISLATGVSAANHGSTCSSPDWKAAPRPPT